ncbi:MAG: hypothetical protein ACPGSB_08565 [Opitutales bacterium]
MSDDSAWDTKSSKVFKQWTQVTLRNFKKTPLAERLESAQDFASHQTERAHRRARRGKILRFLLPRREFSEDFLSFPPFVHLVNSRYSEPHWI